MRQRAARLKGFREAQRWYQDLTAITVEP